MSPTRFNPDLDKEHAQAPIYPKGDYEIVVKDISGFAGVQNEDSQKKSPSVMVFKGIRLSVGVRLRLEMVGKINSEGKLTDDHRSDKVADNTCWIHNKGSKEATKRSIMAIMGYPQKEEKEFNEWYAKQDWGVEVDEGDKGGAYIATPAAGWKHLVGHHVRVRFDKSIYENKETGEKIDQQKFVSWSNVSTPKTSKTVKMA